MNASAVISFENRVLDVHEIPFPAITICSSNKVRPSFVNLTELILKPDRTSHESDILSLAFQVCFMSMQPNASKFLNKRIVDLYTDLGTPNCSDTFFRLKWKTRMVPEPCELFQKVLTNRGICYVINNLPFPTLFTSASVKMYEELQMSENLTSWYNRTLTWSLEGGYTTSELGIARVTPLRTVGSEETLFFKLNFHIEDFDPSCLGGVKGYTLIFHSPMEIATEAHSSFAVKMDSYNMIRVEPTTQSTSANILGWPPEKRGCYLDHEKTLIYFRNYTEGNCYTECESNRSYVICGCVPLYLPRLEHMEVCGPLSTNCFEKSIGDFDNLEEYKKMCDCRPACSDIRYDVTGYSIPVNYTYIDDFPPEQGNKDQRDNWATVSVAFSARSFIPMQRDTVSQLHDFIGNIGGTLGLFLGFSFISLMEIVYFIIMGVIFTIFKNDGQNSL
nr:PREDICTED: pickpocket protein 28-like [Bemisia tabaci]